MCSGRMVGFSAMDESVNLNQPTNINNSTHDHVVSNSSPTLPSSVVDDGFGSPDDCNNGCDCNDDGNDNNGCEGVEIFGGCDFVYNCIGPTGDNAISELTRMIKELTQRLDDKVLLLVLGAMPTSSAARDASSFKDPKNHGQGSGGTAVSGQGQEKVGLFPGILGFGIPPFRIEGGVHGGGGDNFPGIGVGGDICLGCSGNEGKGFLINNFGQPFYCLPVKECPEGDCDTHIGSINQVASNWPNRETNRRVDHKHGANGVRSTSATAPASG
ncbi:Uncharacterized protein TCM_029889 [Theobroma cacao]|uniref:Uncharacterized protein n=1 Tax=Theobroma cacao TaxID=3641 RepID=A0A061GFT2_THECC|nr:Uncharacterized protein TCM_029889 [Theobroma cacao]